MVKMVLILLVVFNRWLVVDFVEVMVIGCVLNSVLIVVSLFLLFICVEVVWVLIWLILLMVILVW